jgi:molecular chaperone DnaK (HSP70)
MTHHDVVVGIDLGTTNSSVAVVRDGRPVVLSVEGAELLPSVVGLSPAGALLVGQTARNQLVLHPQRTVRSVKRHMGSTTTFTLGDQEFSPVEVSAIIIGRLKAAAEQVLGQPVTRAVITVPAYFSDAQRTATKEAGEVAGLQVERILNEPTAAALCYAQQEEIDRTLMVYDLGGGTFDVSIVRQRGEVTEVLASHGDTALGGDDFDRVLKNLLQERFEETHGFAIDDDLRAMARLSRAAEEAKIQLSTESYVRAVEEHLAEQDGVGHHLDVELSRPEYEALIDPFVARTKDSVQTALREAKLLASDLDDIILVGGASRTPLVGETLEQLLQQTPRMDINPDKAVALGAALHAGRVAGQDLGRILVDVTPFTFGTSYFGELNGRPSPDCFQGIIKRNTPLPARQTQIFYTMTDGQERVLAQVYQGESDDARDNQLIGQFLVEGLDLDAPAHSPILFDMKLNLDGILEVEVTEQGTGLKKGVTIEDAFRKLDPAELAAARRRMEALLGGMDVDFDTEDQVPGPLASSPGAAPGDHETLPPLGAPSDLTPEERRSWSQASSLKDKAQRLLPDLETADRDEVSELVDQLHDAMEQANLPRMNELSGELADVLFYLE